MDIIMHIIIWLPWEPLLLRSLWRNSSRLLLLLLPVLVPVGTGNHWTLPFGVSHSTVGWCLSFVLFSQLLIGLIRPGKEFAETRRSWFFIHVTLGYATVILSIIALVTGCSAALEDGHLQLILGVFVPVIVLLYICTYYFYREESNRKRIYFYW